MSHCDGPFVTYSLWRLIRTKMTLDERNYQEHQSSGIRFCAVSQIRTSVQKETAASSPRDEQSRTPSSSMIMTVTFRVKTDSTRYTETSVPMYQNTEGHIRHESRLQSHRRQHSKNHILKFNKFQVSVVFKLTKCSDPDTVHSGR